MQLSFVLAIAILIQACAPMSEEEYDLRQYQRIDRNNNFLEYEHRCNLAGGLVHIERRGGGPYRAGPPDRNDHYQCLAAHGTREFRVFWTNSHDSSQA